MPNTNSRNTIMGDVSLTTNAVVTTFREATNLNARVQSNRRLVAESMKNMSVVNFLAGLSVPIIAATSLSKELLSNPLMIVCIALFCVAVLTGLYGIVNSNNITSATVDNYRFIIGGGMILMAVGIIFLIAALSLTPNPEFEKENKEEEEEE